MKTKHLAKKLGLELSGQGNGEITSPATLLDAGASDISFYHNPKYRSQLADTRAGAVILRRKDYFEGANFDAILSENPLDDFRRAVEILVPAKRLEPVISELAHIHEKAKIGKDVRIEPFAVIGIATIGDRTVISAGAVLGDNVRIGQDCIIYPRAVIYDGVRIGDRVIIHAGAVLGSDGFGYSRANDGSFNKIPQVGALVIGDDVEIGANTTIDRGSPGNTVVGKGTKIDNLVQIGHNTVIGANCACAGQAGMAGSCIVGDRVLLGGQAGLAGHLTLGNDVVVHAQAGVDKSYGDNIILSGAPARPVREAWRQQAAIAKLPEIIRQLRKKEK